MTTEINVPVLQTSPDNVGDSDSAVATDQVEQLETPIDEPVALGDELLELSADEIEVVDQQADSPPEDVQAGAETDAEEAVAGSGNDQPTTQAPPDTLPPLRDAMLQRIDQSLSLPRGLRSRLTKALQAAPLAEQAGDLLVPADLLLNVIEQWSPEALRLDPRSLCRPEHPDGDTFFTGDPNALSDEQAERIARQQLQRSGYLPRSRSA